MSSPGAFNPQMNAGFQASVAQSASAAAAQPAAQSVDTRSAGAEYVFIYLRKEKIFLSFIFI